jgi:hypothetical protein
VRADEILIRVLTAADLPAFAAFRCSDGAPFEDAVEEQIRDPLPLRYLASPPRFDGRMLIGVDRDGGILVAGAHHIEPTLVPDVGYTEVIAVASHARGTLVQLPQEQEISLGEFMLYASRCSSLAGTRAPSSASIGATGEASRCATVWVCRKSNPTRMRTSSSDGESCRGANS